MDIMESQEVPEIQANVEVLSLKMVQEDQISHQSQDVEENLETFETQEQQEDE